MVSASYTLTSAGRNFNRNSLMHFPIFVIHVKKNNVKSLKVKNETNMNLEFDVYFHS